MSKPAHGRWTPINVFLENGGVLANMAEVENGDYVQSDDYAALLSLSAEKDKTIADLDALVQSLQNRWAARPLSNVDSEHLERENIEKDKRIATLEAAFKQVADNADRWGFYDWHTQYSFEDALSQVKEAEHE